MSILTDHHLAHEGETFPLHGLETDAEVERRVLTTSRGRDLLAEAAATPRPGPADLARWRRSHPSADVSAAIRLVETRRRGASKFEQARSMWFEPVGLEQATAEAVARHKARRFAGSIVVDLCCGVGGDTTALARSALGVMAVDLDEGMTQRARWNAEVHGVGHKVAPVLARAEETEIPAGALVHVDPDRRALGSTARARSIEDYAPGLDYLRALIGGARGGAIKLGPASDFDHAFGGLPVEIELTSLGGECKEATVWFGCLASARRRATCLPSGETWTDRDAEGETPRAPVAERPGPWIFDPDPALVRSGLLDGFAASRGLSRLLPGSDFLTGPGQVESGFLAAFEVVEVLPLDLKRLRRVVSERRLGPLEIKTKGLDLRPEDLRRTLRPEGPNAATLILAGGPGASVAAVARRA